MMNSKFTEEKGQLMRDLLDHLDVRVRSNKRGWQQVRCPVTARHPTGDRHPSGSVNLEAGKYHCFACGTRGDAYDLAEAALDLSPDSLNKLLTPTPGTHSSRSGTGTASTTPTEPLIVF